MKSDIDKNDLMRLSVNFDDSIDTKTATSIDEKNNVFNLTINRDKLFSGLTNYMSKMLLGEILKFGELNECNKPEDVPRIKKFFELNKPILEHIHTEVKDVRYNENTKSIEIDSNPTPGYWENEVNEEFCKNVVRV